MSFARPLLLLALLAVPVLVAVYVRHERRPSEFAPAKLMPSVAPRRSAWRRHAALVGYAAAVVALLVSLAKPRATVAVPTEQARVMVVTDRSGSMQATDVEPTRLAAAKRAVGTFLDRVPDDLHVGAIAYNKKAEVLQSPTRDRDAVREALKAVQPHGRTATGDAIKIALSDLRGDAPAAIVLLSDGKSVLGSAPVAAAQAAKQRHIPIYTVTLGTDHGTVDGKSVQADASTLQQIASASGGRAYTAKDAGELARVYKQLASKVAKEKRPVEVTSLLAGGAFVLMAFSALSSLGLRGRLI